MQGCLCEGQFKNGLLHGKAREIENYSKVYNGEWSMGHYNGHGRLTKADGSVHEGMWENDKIVTKK